MASVQDVFAQMQSEQTEVLEDETFIPDPNEYCVLESDATRRILIPQKYAVFGVESDDKTNRIKFAFPKAVNDIQDLSQYNIRFNYIDAKGNTDQITARNMQVQGDYILFDWILTRNVTRYQGNISFIVCAVTVKEDGVISNEWNTTVATAQSLEGIETEPTPGEEQIARDLLTELLVSLNNSKNDAITEITQTKTQAISDVETEGQTQTEAVDAKGTQVLESIPDDYTMLEKRVDELEQNRAYVIVGNGSGEFVTLNDSSELKTRNVKLFGKSVQAETNGYNLFDLKHLVDLINEHTVESGCSAEILDYATGIFKIMHPPYEKNNAINLGFKISEMCYNLQTDSSYNTSTFYTGLALYIEYIDDDSSIGKRLLFGNNETTFSTSAKYMEGNCVLYTSVTGMDGIEQSMFSKSYICDSANKDYLKNDYEVFTNGIAQEYPTPDYPLPITSAGNYDADSEKYEVGIGVDGVNLLDYESWKGTNIYNGTGIYKDNGIIITATGEDCYTVWSTHNSQINVLPNTTYVLSWEHSGSYGLVYVFEGTTSNGSFPVNKFVGATDNKLTFKTEHNTKYIRFRVGVLNSGKTATYKNIQLNVGDTPLEFRPFQGTQQKQLQIPNPLRGIPVDSGGNYTDADGQQWICDYIDRERGKYVQCVQEIVFDGSNDEVWNYSGKCVFVEINDYNRFGQIEASCDCFKYDTWENVSMGYVNNCYTVFQYNTWTRLRIAFFKTDIGNNVQEFKSWLQSNPVTVLYRVDEPIETDLTSDQLAALNLSTYQGITNIGTDTMPQVGIDVEYIADTKIYIDNAIAEAIAAIPTE